MAYTTRQTRKRLCDIAYKFNISSQTNGYTVNLLRVHWASEKEVKSYFDGLNYYCGSCDFSKRRDCEYIVVDTMYENEYGSIYSNDLWAVIPINELPYRMARQVVNMLNNGIYHCEL